MGGSERGRDGGRGGEGRKYPHLDPPIQKLLRTALVVPMSILIQSICATAIVIL
jgi:hypothetical protein